MKDGFKYYEFNKKLKPLISVSAEPGIYFNLDLVV